MLYNPFITAWVQIGFVPVKLILLYVEVKSANDIFALTKIWTRVFL